MGKRKWTDGLSVSELRQLARDARADLKAARVALRDAMEGVADAEDTWLEAERALNAARRKG